MLFGDMPLSAWSNGSGVGEPWTSFDAVNQLVAAGKKEEARQSLRRIIATPDLESRHYLEAWLGLRELGVAPPDDAAKQVLGVVVEVGLKNGLDMVAAYRDRSALYENYCGSVVVWEHPDGSLDAAVKSLLDAGQEVADEIGPWDEPRPKAPPAGQVRINMLTPSGLHFGQGPFAGFAADPLGGIVVAAAMALMKGLIGKTSPHRS